MNSWELESARPVTHRDERPDGPLAIVVDPVADPGMVGPVDQAVPVQHEQEGTGERHG